MSFTRVHSFSLLRFNSFLTPAAVYISLSGPVLVVGKCGRLLIIMDYCGRHPSTSKRRRRAAAVVGWLAGIGLNKSPSNWQWNSEISIWKQDHGNLLATLHDRLSIDRSLEYCLDLFVSSVFHYIISYAPIDQLNDSWQAISAIYWFN